jgi:hypothetical protein
LLHQAIGSWFAALATGLALQSAPLTAYGAEMPPPIEQPEAQASPAAEGSAPERLQAPPLCASEMNQFGEVPHNCRPRCIWGDAVCRALLGERWSDTGESCDSDADLLGPELLGDDDAPPPYVSAPQRQQQLR